MKSPVGGDVVPIRASSWWGTRGQQRLPFLDQVLSSGGKRLIFSFSSELVDMLAQARCLQ